MPRLRKLFQKKFHRFLLFFAFFGATLILLPLSIWIDVKVTSEALKTQTLKLNALFAFYHNELIKDAEQYLLLVSKFPSVQNLDKPECKKILVNTGSNQRFLNVAVFNLEGNLVCSTIDTNEQINVTDRRYFQQALQQDSFAISDYLITRISKKPTIIFAYPIKNDQSKAAGVVAGSIDPSWLDDMINSEEPPPGMNILIFDRNSKVLYSYPNEKLEGQEIADSDLYKRVLIDQKGSVEASDISGTRTVFSFSPLSSQYEGLYLAVGSEKRGITPTILSIITPRNSWISLLTLVIVALVWIDLYFLFHLVREFRKIKL